MTTNEKISALRKEMQAENIDCYIVNTADPHQSEYISSHFKERAWISGFTGSAGTALITMDKALVWADGRYYIQAAHQIEDSEFELKKLGQKDVPNVNNWILKNLATDTRVGISQETFSQKNFEELRDILKENSIELVALPSLIARIWQDRPALPDSAIFEHELQFTGQTASEKVQVVREHMKKDKADATIIVGLDDVAWLYNFRGGDVANNPVALAFAIVTLQEAALFIDQNKLDAKMKNYFSEQDIIVNDYNAVSEYIANMKVSTLVVQKNRISTELFQSIPENVKVVDKKSYVTMTKACLNEVELKNQRISYLRDSAAVARYLFWLKREVRSTRLNEFEAQEKLHELRSAGENFIDESFTSISAYGPNAAMMHYSADAENSTMLEPKSFYLIDSGGQYFDGTTDITRTIALGELTEEEITDYTLTLKGHINLATAIFMEDTTGAYLEVLARQPLWKHHMDYKCGTGHAVGYVLGVHEGPQSISRNGKVPLKEGMIVTNEPGVYKEGKHGIRLENDYVIVYDGELLGDRFFRFEVLSFVPFDRSAINPALLNDEELAWLNKYHKQCYNHLINQMVNEEEKSDLKEACAPLEK